MPLNDSCEPLHLQSAVITTSVLEPSTGLVRRRSMSQRMVMVGLGESDVGGAGYTISSAIAESHVGVAGGDKIKLTVCIQSWWNKS